jgi:2-dehydropantoate 2-reductase
MLVVGAGAIGDFYGAHLAHTGRNVTFLVRPGRAGQLARTGLAVKSPKGDISLMPNVVTANVLKSVYDVILIAVKGFALESVIADVAPAVGPDSMILAPLNGMKHIDILTAQFGQRPVIGCIARIGVDLDSEGHIVHFAPMEDMAYGERDGSRSERAMALDSFMKEAGFTARLSDNISREV